MDVYKESYFILFTAICNVFDTLEIILQADEVSDDAKTVLDDVLNNLRLVQQQAEESLISK